MFRNFDNLFSQAERLFDQQNVFFNQINPHYHTPRAPEPSSNWQGRKVVRTYNYELPQQTTSVLVGATPITATRLRDSARVLQEFISDLLTEEFQRKETGERVIKNLIGAKDLVDEAVAFLNDLKFCIHQIKKFKNDLRLKDRTELITNYLNKTESLLASAEEITLPAQLTKDSVAQFKNDVTAITTRVNHELASMLNNYQHVMHDIVKQTTEVAQKTFNEPVNEQPVVAYAENEITTVIAQYKQAAADILDEIGTEAECARDLIPHLKTIRNQAWDALLQKGIQGKTNEEYEKWNLSVYNELEVEKEIFAQVNQAISNANKNHIEGIGPIALVQSLVKQIGSEGNYFLSKISGQIGPEADKLKAKFAALIKSPALTLDELDHLIQETGKVCLKWSQAQNEASKDWLYSLERLSCKAKVAKNFLLTDAQDNKVFFEELETERQNFHQWQYTFVDKQYDDIIGTMKKAQTFRIDKDKLNTLDTYLINWNKAFSQIEPKRELFKTLREAENKFTKSIDTAKLQMEEWQNKYQLVLKEKLADLIQKLQADVSKKKAVIGSIKHVENFIKLTHDYAEQVYKHIENAREMPLTDVISAYNKNPELANKVRDYFVQGLKKKLTTCHFQLDLLRKKHEENPEAESFLKTIEHQAKTLTVYSKTHDVLVDPMSGETEPVLIEDLTNSQLKDYEEKVYEVIRVAKAEARRAAARAKLTIEF